MGWECTIYNKILGGGFLNISWVNRNQFDLRMFFQMGWFNHHLAEVSKVSCFFLLQKKKCWNNLGPFRTFQKCCQVFFCDDHFADVFRATRLWFPLFFHFHPEPGGKWSENLTCAWFFSNMGLVKNDQLSCPDIFFRVHEEERFVGVSNKRGYIPKWMVYI